MGAFKKRIKNFSEPIVDQARTGILTETLRLRKEITVLDELKAFIPPLSPEEYAFLKSDILENGCREALIVWTTTRGVIESTTDESPLHILVDGHNRYGICQQHGIDFKVTLKDFATFDLAKQWMIRNQIGRRNLTPENYSFLRGKLYNTLKQEKGQYDRTLLEAKVDTYDRVSIEPDARHDIPAKPKQTTAEALAAQFKVTEKTIRKDGYFASGIEKLSPGLQRDILSKDVRIPKGDIMKLGMLQDVTDRVETKEELMTLLNSDSKKIKADQPPKKDTDSRKGKKVTRQAVQEKHEVKNKLAELNLLIEKDQINTLQDCDHAIALIQRVLASFEDLKVVLAQAPGKDKSRTSLAKQSL